MKILPLRIEKIGQRILYIEWSDGEEFEYDVVELRRSCRCARCVHEITGELLIKPEQIAETVRPLRVSSMGHYALSFSWTDGHSSSIFSWEHLRMIAKLPY